MASVVETESVTRVPEDSSPWEAEEVIHSLRHAIEVSMDEQLLTDAVGRMQSAIDMRPDTIISMLSHFDDLPEQLMRLVLREFDREERSAYGVFNAMTSVARETRDPERKWRLEDTAGGVLARLPVSPQAFDSGVAIRLA